MQVRILVDTINSQIGRNPDAVEQSSLRRAAKTLAELSKTGK